MNRKILGLILACIIIAMSIIVYMNRDKMFTSKVIIAYKDGCKETYINTKLVTPQCALNNYIYENKFNFTLPGDYNWQ